ncbi:flavodoxin family protein [Acidaminobacter sp. JC074]|uniref:flavodoxin family protein n=1 Tax=Acidaminobacter sp. JC074 TaxID=2530199 RepID=UPI001F0E82B5|nr:flavodoxin family protein [Acidaminobacter sp. JC074]MCH4886218.1 flavodoxin family protein [Acidaminobacter sp. JC074]
MRVCILMGSFRKDRNTETLTKTLIRSLEEEGIEVDYITLRDKHIEPCTACWTCQDVFDGPGCPKEDDCDEIFKSVLKSDCIILATPIYSWYCTPPMKALLDRMVYTMNKYYGEVEGPCLWQDKKIGIVTTCGYGIEKGAGVFEEGIRRYAEHSKLDYIGMIGMKDKDDLSIYQGDEAKLLLSVLVDNIKE